MFCHLSNLPQIRLLENLVYKALAIGIVISISLAVILVLMGQDEVQSLIAGLLTTVITLSVDVIARLRESERRILEATTFGELIQMNQELHSTLHQITRSYQITQKSGFDLFIERSKDTILDCKDVLGALERGYTMVEAGGKYSYGRRGVRRAQTQVKAVAYEDIGSWRTVHLQDVLKVNAEAIQRGVQIQRLFILNNEGLSEAEDVLKAHKDSGVEVFTVSPDDLPATQLLESYQIVDDEILVIFYYTRDGKSFREEKVSIEPVEVDRAVSRFESTLRRATPYA